MSTSSSEHAHSKTVYHSKGGASSEKALNDILGGFVRSPLWRALSWQDIRLRYRGSMLGPFWLSISMGVMVLSLGTVYSHIFKMELEHYMPYLVAGLMVWQYMSVMLSEACTSFTSAEGFIRQIRQPYSIYVYRSVCRNAIIFAHNFVIFILVAMYFKIWPGFAFLQIIPGLALLLINSVWIGIFFGLLCARFRDITQMVNSLLQVFFFVTPIIWYPELMKDRPVLVDINPFHHFIELIRAPLLGKDVEMLSWYFALGVTVVGWFVTFLFFRRYRARLAYWV